MRKILQLLCGLALVAGGLGACGGESSDQSADSADTTMAPEGGEGAAGEQVSITAKDHAFEAPSSIKGGLVNVTMRNVGREPHFVGFVKPVQGKTAADVIAALAAQKTPVPTGPPPFEDVAGVSMADGGESGTAAFRLKPGSYVIMCSIPNEQGVPHFALGMANEITVTEPAPEEVGFEDADAEIVGLDMALTPVPKLKAGRNVIKFRNDGKQLHEINTVEFLPGKSAADVMAWFRQRGGPPPTKSLGGVAVQVGEEGTTEVELKRGVTYAFVCAIDDVLSDFQPHVVKGMMSSAFTAA